MQEDIAESLEAKIRARNADLRSGAWIEMVLGVFWTLGTVVFLWCLGAWILAQFWKVPFAWISLAALVLCGLYMAVAFWTVRRGVDVVELAPAMDEMELARVRMAAISGDLFYINPRFAGLGGAMLVLAGPTSILNARKDFRSLWRVDAALLRDAADLLLAARQTLLISVEADLRPASLLLAMRFLEIRPHGEDFRATVSRSGQRFLDDHLLPPLPPAPGPAAPAQKRVIAYPRPSAE